MKQGRIYSGDELDKDLTVSCDVCIVGSGPGGAFLADALCARGLSVVMLEEGGYRTRRDFDMDEARAFRTLFQELGNRSTDDLSLSILQGRSVGGGTTVNWCSSFRTPERILQHWREVHGVSGLTPEALAPHFEAIEKRLSIAEWPLERINGNNRVLWEGLGKLGHQRALIRRNVLGCVDLGHCMHGCPLDAKQSMAVTVLPDAVERGLTLFANASARRIEWSGRRAVAVQAAVLHPERDVPTGVRLRVEAKAVAVSGGAINSPALLLRSGIHGRGRVGRRTFVHPTVASLGLFDHPVNGLSGAPQSVSSHQFIGRGPGRLGFLLEVSPIHPILAGIVVSGSPAQHRAAMEALPRSSALIALAVDGLLPNDEGGTVSLRPAGDGELGRPRLDYPLVAHHWEAFREASREMARIQFAAGAREVRTLHTRPVVMRSPDELSLLDAAPWAPLELRVLTAHQMGGCAMGGAAERSVVDASLRLHDFDNLFVVDGSVFPTSLGANPQLSIMAVARWAAPGVASAAV